MLYAQKKSTTAPTAMLKKRIISQDNSFTVYSMCKKYAIYSLKI